jgi:hypothetical protein
VTLPGQSALALSGVTATGSFEVGQSYSPGASPPVDKSDEAMTNKATLITAIAVPGFIIGVCILCVNAALRGIAWHCVPLRGTAWQLCGTVWHCVALRVASNCLPCAFRCVS